MKRNQDGFTLVELLVTIAVGSLVTLAATTVLLLGLRINNRSTKTVIRQNTARVVITMLENLAAEGEITSIDRKEDQPAGKRGWEIRSADNAILASYSEEKQAVYVGSADKNPDDTPAKPLLEEVTASTISLDQSGLLSVSLTIDDIPYESSIYCRTMRAPKKEETVTENKIEAKEDYVVDETKVGRTAFLNVLASQYRLKGGSPNPGLILDADKLSTGEYYSEWYLGKEYPNDSGWGPETPWCACFVSWALCQKSVADYVDGGNKDIDGDGTGDRLAFASVDNFYKYLVQNSSGHTFLNSLKSENEYNEPAPGDIIFFDWSKGQDPAHVGVVLKIEGGNVYTIEGNSAGIVAVRKYDIKDPVIMGYGVIHWTS